MKNIIEQILLLFMFMATGYALAKFKIADKEHTKILSVVLVYIFLPATVFKAFCKNFKITSICEYYSLILASAAILLVLIVFAIFTSDRLSNDGYERNIYKYSMIISNYGYMGYALAEGIYGSVGLLNMIIFAIPFTLFTYTFGFCMLTGSRVSAKRLVNPVMISLIAGAVCGLFNISVSGTPESFIDKASGCMGPVSMLLAGMTVAEFHVKELLLDKKAYAVSLIRLIGIPFCLFLILNKLPDKNIVRTAVLLSAMPCGLNTIVFPKLVGKDSMTGARLTFISNILAVVSIPMILKLL